MIASLLETCKLSAVDPLAWLTDVLTTSSLTDGRPPHRRADALGLRKARLSHKKRGVAGPLRLKLATRPIWTGSKAVLKTIGIVMVAALAASAACVLPTVAMTATWRRMRDLPPSLRALVRRQTLKSG